MDHDLRQSFVTRKITEGWDRDHVKAITGHRTDKVFARYNKPSLETLRAVVEGTSSTAVVKLLANGPGLSDGTVLSASKSLCGGGWGPVAPPVFKTELRGVTLRGWFDSIPSPPHVSLLLVRN